MIYFSVVFCGLKRFAVAAVCGCVAGAGGGTAALRPRWSRGSPQGKVLAPLPSEAQQPLPAAMTGQKNVYVSRRFMLETRSICRDRLGTNIGEIQPKDSSLFSRLW